MKTSSLAVLLALASAVSLGASSLALTQAVPRHLGAIQAAPLSVRPNFTPASIAAIYRHYRSQRPVQGEYETTDAFARRASAELATAHAAVFGVVVPRATKDCNGYEVRYEADFSQLIVGLSFSDEGIPVLCSTTAGRSYPGQNAFGVNRTIQEWTEISYFLAPRGSSGDETPSAYIEMPPAQAKLVRNRLRVIVFFSPRGTADSGFVDDETTVQTPTLSDPRRLTQSVRRLRAEIEAWFIIDPVTGKELASYRRRSSPPQ